MEEQQVSAPEVVSPEVAADAVVASAPSEVPSVNEKETLAVDLEHVSAMLEALLLAYGEPIEVQSLAGICGVEEAQVKSLLSELQEKYRAETFGIEIVEVAEKFQFRTKGIFAAQVRELKAALPRRLSSAALETLAIIAYRQPIVRSDIEQVRGVDVSPTLKTLLERNLVRIVGHQPTVGQPALYGTTEEFLKLFGLKSLGELPTLRDIKEMEQAPREEEGSDLSEDAAAEAVDSEQADSEVVSSQEACSTNGNAEAPNPEMTNSAV